MSKPLVSDELWSAVEPWLPGERPNPKGERPRVPDRAALAGIIFVLRTGIPREYLPRELGGGSGVTCWRRLGDWQRSEVWRYVLRTVQQRLADSEAIDRSRASLDAASLPARKQWSRLSTGNRLSRLPMDALTEQGVEDGQELVHAHRERHLLRPAGRDQMLVEPPEDRVALDGDQGAHPQRRPDPGPSAPDDATPAQAAALAVERRHAHEGCDLLAV
jgi:transposase